MSELKSRALRTVMLMICTLPILCMEAVGQDRPIWRIGEFDHSSGEFRSDNIDYADPKSDPVFIIGKSDVSRDWYRFQPGQANGATGGRLHPFTIRFVLGEKPYGTYRLRIAMLYETPRLPYLEVRVNGHSGFFYFHPKLDYYAGDWEGTFVPQTSADDKTIEIPARWLKQGENELVLTAIDTPGTPQNSLGAIAPGHTGIIYDSLEFSQSVTNSKQFSALVEPTIFYKQGEQGLREIVTVFTSSTEAPKRSATVTMTIAGHRYRQPVQAGEFGETRTEFEIPAWQGENIARVQLGNARAEVTIKPAKKWTVAIITHEHLDIGFTDYPAKVAELHAQSIDGAMQLISRTPDFRWTLDGSWVADQYLRGRDQKSQQGFIDQVRRGNIVIPKQFANLHTANASWEALTRSFYDERRLERMYSLPENDAAQIVDVPSYPWAYASVLHNAGVKYFVAASNSWRAPTVLLGRWNEKSPFYWEGPDGGRVLMWYARAYLQMHTLFGSPWGIEAVRDALPVFLQAYSRPDYTADTAIIVGSQLENTPLAKEQSEIVHEVGNAFAYPRLRFSTVHDALQQIEREWKGTIPVYRGDFGPYWEDGYGSDARYTAMHRQNQHRVQTAEIMGATLSNIDTRLRPDQDRLGDAWRNTLLYDEHTWTYVGATTQPEHHQSEDQIALKESRVERARNDINEEIQRSWAQFESLVSTKEQSLIVFNSLNWMRNGLVEADLAAGAQLVDTASGNVIDTEVLSTGKGIALPGFGGAYDRVRFEAPNVPAVGYKVFAIRTGKVPVKLQSRADGNILENRFYRVTIDPGTAAITSIFDKQLNRELVDATSPYRFGEYLYVTGGDDVPNNSLYRFGAALPPPKLGVHGATAGSLLSVQKTAYGAVGTLQASAPNTPSIRVEITLYDSEKKIGIEYRLHKDRVLSREAAYFAFPFAGSERHFEFGSQDGWVDPAKDELLGGSREWYLASSWTAVQNDGVAGVVVPIDAPLVAFGDIVRGNWPASFNPRSSTIFSWVMNNYWGTNFPAWQGGDFTFRYVIHSAAKLDRPELQRLALTELTPLERDDLAASTGEPSLPSKEASLLSIDNAAVALLTFKRAEDGEGSILRLQDTSGIPQQVNIKSAYFKFQRAWLCNALEDKKSEIPVNDGAVSFTLKPFQVLTLRVDTPIPSTRAAE
jgi:alpha-mannosidase